MAVKEYARCDDGGCTSTKGVWPGRRRGAPTSPEDKDKVYRCNSDAEKPCKGTKEAKCTCFVVATHVVKNETTEEKAYPGSSTKDGETDLLDEATRKDKYPGPKETGGSAKDHWVLSCTCLKVDKKGDPQSKD